MKTLDEIGKGYRTDKSSPYHNYLNIYENYFAPLRDKQIVLLELGVGDIKSFNREGESLLMWRDYFINGKCYGVDKDPKELSGTFVCDQTDEQGLNNVIRIISNPNIIIDDCSHVHKNTIRSFEILFPFLKSGGLYCIEDTVTSYWPGWEGSEEFFHYDSIERPTIMSYMLHLCHCINLKKQHTFNPARNIDISDWIKSIESIHFHYSQIIIKKK